MFDKKVYWQAYYAAHKDEIAERKVRFYKANKEKIAGYYLANKARILAYGKGYRAGLKARGDE